MYKKYFKEQNSPVESLRNTILLFTCLHSLLMLNFFFFPPPLMLNF